MSYEKFDKKISAAKSLIDEISISGDKLLATLVAVLSTHTKARIQYTFGYARENYPELYGDEANPKSLSEARKVHNEIMDELANLDIENISIIWAHKEETLPKSNTGSLHLDRRDAQKKRINQFIERYTDKAISTLTSANLLPRSSHYHTDVSGLDGADDLDSWINAYDVIIRKHTAAFVSLEAANKDKAVAIANDAWEDA